MSSRRSSAKPVVDQVITGYCPTLGNAVRVTLYQDGQCMIERQAYTRTQRSRHDGSLITHTQTFAVLTEPASLHYHLISSLQQPAYWPEHP